MSKKLVLPEHDFLVDPDDAGFNQRHSYKALLDNINTTISRNDLEESIRMFKDERESLRKAIKHSLAILKNQPLLTAFLIWSEDNYVKKDYPDYAKMLVQMKFIKFEDGNEHLLIIKNLKENFFYDILESIRCTKNLDIWQREMLVLSFRDFVNWMWAVTRLSAFDIKDWDKERTYARLFEYDDFIKFVSKLDNKFQVIAKLLYFGGDRNLEEVLSLNVQDISFSNKTITYGNERIPYSLHVFEDLKEIIGIKTSGRVFIGRQNSPLNPATVFRNFKEAALKAGLDPSFSPKTLLMSGKSV